VTMLLDAVEIENFGPYYGEQIVTLPSESGSLILVHGENMAGKTSFLNAIRWALYGYAKDRAGKPIPIRKLINADAYDEGQRRLGVRLRLRVRSSGQEVQLILRRQRQAKQGLTAATADADYEEFREIDFGGSVRPASEFDDYVNMLLPEGISRFFLFDGELLNEYEELVSEGGSHQAQMVQQSIEMILGVPAATRGRDDLEFLRKEVSKKYQREAKLNSSAREAAERLENESAALQRAQDDLAEMNRQLGDRERELRAYEIELKKFSEMREDATRLKDLRDQKDELDVERQKAVRRRAELAKDVWRDVLEPRLRHEIARLDRDLRIIRDAITEADRVESEIARLEKSLTQDTCPTCGRPVPEEHLARSRADLEELLRRREDLRDLADRSRHDELSGALGRLRDVAPAGVIAGIQEIERQMRSNTIAATRVLQQISQVEQRLHGSNPAEFTEYERKRKETNRLIAKIEAAIGTRQGEVRQREAVIANLERAINEQNLPALRRLQIHLDLVKSLEGLFTESVAELTTRLRRSVESAATDVFLGLTTDPLYEGLRINDHYGLAIVGPGGREVLIRSAGAEQVVALSLIGALNRSATRKGPVIMDTPFGRLDPTHRANILKFLPTLGDQVILLVHSGEIDPDRDLGPIATSVRKRIVIEHETSTRSVLREV
jgi:DNA sulfur modification protein DndD